MSQKPPSTNSLSTRQLDERWLRWLGTSRPDPAVARSLITKNPDWVDPAGCGPLVWVLRNHRAKPSAARLTRMLVEMGLDPNEPAGRISPLFEAVYQGDARSVRYLLSQDLNLNDKSRVSALSEACGTLKKRDLVLLLLKVGHPIGSIRGSRGLVGDMAAGLGSDSRQAWRPNKFWNEVAGALLSSPARWDEFKGQLREWAQNEEVSIGPIEGWLCAHEAALLSVHCAPIPPRARSVRL